MVFPQQLVVLSTALLHWQSQRIDHCRRRQATSLHSTQIPVDGATELGEGDAGDDLTRFQTEFLEGNLQSHPLARWGQGTHPLVCR